MKLIQRRLTAALVFHRTGEIVGDEIPVARIGAPNLVNGLADLVPNERAQRRGVRPVVGEREVELQVLRSDSLHRHILARIDAVRGPDQEAEDERGQEREKSNDRPDHVARSAGGEFFWQKVLQEEADSASGEHGDGDAERKFLRTH